MGLPGQARHHYVEHLLKNYPYDYLIGKSDMRYPCPLHTSHFSQQTDTLSHVS
jgi:hypothetical protein